MLLTLSKKKDTGYVQFCTDKGTSSIFLIFRACSDHVKDLRHRTDCSLSSLETPKENPINVRRPPLAPLKVPPIFLVLWIILVKHIISFLLKVKYLQYNVTRQKLMDMTTLCATVVCTSLFVSGLQHDHYCFHFSWHLKLVLVELVTLILPLMMSTSTLDSAVSRYVSNKMKETIY